ncbi:putative phage abortive infection protein [Aeromonas veronii]|uniref:putative phage abortive infection protein n=1 Tax=Aeromonas veronii TaxID=654 RepID=UPI003D19BB9B
MSDPIDNNKLCSFFSRFREHTFYSVFKKALIGNQNLSNSDELLLKVLHLMLVSGIFLLLALLSANFLIAMPQNSSELGTFGDFLGGVLNPIFTLMTFFGVIVTIALQKLELRAAREEYKKSADALGTQAVENTFFNMIDLHHKITSQLKFTTNGFKIKTESISSGHKHQDDKNQKLLNIQQFSGYEGSRSFAGCIVFISKYAQTNSDVVKLYKYIQENHNDIFGHYFRNLFQIMKFIDEHTELTQNSKIKYTGILRAQLSRDELTVLFINCMGNMVDNGEFRKLLTRYHMLEHMYLYYSESIRHYIKDDWVYTGPYFTLGNLPIADNTTINDFLSDEENYCGAFGKHPLLIQQKNANL